jgi:hypothetical protein
MWASLKATERPIDTRQRLAVKRSWTCWACSLSSRRTLRRERQLEGVAAAKERGD